ncbi:ly-6/neurotoxin-like protein 1 [Mastomys coucha]|uniref:ly-6/neurotoxin-like protein 1 n=1 Tax=Mastomys coucha TaxID=35658 RepID=UPI0012624251|nr:ly-6/neurotoxin-like protein 1 [Mastomys coucha]
MRTHLLWLLPLILLGSSAQALQCHECSGRENCYRPTPCSNMSRYCLTNWYTPPGQEMKVTKACAYTCPDIHQTTVNSKSSCCNTDLCNSAGSLHVSWGLLALSLWYIYLSQ